MSSTETVRSERQPLPVDVHELAGYLAPEVPGNPFIGDAYYRLHPEASSRTLGEHSASALDTEVWCTEAAAALTPFAINTKNIGLAKYIFDRVVPIDQWGMYATAATTEDFPGEVSAEWRKRLESIDDSQDNEMQIARLTAQTQIALYQYPDELDPERKDRLLADALGNKQRILELLPWRHHARPKTPPFDVDLAFYNAGFESEVFPPAGDDLKYFAQQFSFKAAAGQLSSWDKIIAVRILAGPDGKMLRWINARQNSEQPKLKIRPRKWKKMGTLAVLSALVPELIYESGAQMQPLAMLANNLQAEKYSGLLELYKSLPDLGCTHQELLQASLLMAQFYPKRKNPIA